MSVLQITALVILALAVGRLPRSRQLAMLAISAFAVFWLQPAEPFVSLVFWFPIATLAITVLSWALTATADVRGWDQNWAAGLVLLAVILVEDLRRYLRVGQLQVVAAPALPLLLLALLTVGALTLVILRWQRTAGFWRLAAILAILGAFVLLKSPLLSGWTYSELTSLRGAGSAAGTTPLSWLGFSYLAFRLLHTIRDRQTGRLPPVSLAEYVNYAIFFPSFTSGPIDRLERFVKDLRSPLPLADSDWLEAGSRLLLGLFKKFVIADLLAVISINDLLVTQVRASGWLWLFLYAYAFRIYFDFSGYTDLAIGMGRLMGVRLPENFAAPYLKPNLTQFWNSWHMSLTQWFRAYVFNPLTRALRTLKYPAPAWIIILAAQISTMVLIGLWHGITWGFFAWGLWHGLGLFVHNRWTELSRNRMPAWTETPRAFDLVGGGRILYLQLCGSGMVVLHLVRAWSCLVGDAETIRLGVGSILVDDSIMSSLENYISSTILKQTGRRIGGEAALISSGLINSFSLVGLALFVEDEFGVRIEDTELNAQTFDNLNQLTALIESRRS